MQIKWRQSRLRLTRAAGLIAISALLALAPVPVIAAPVTGPFAALQGSWTGSGTIALSSGAKERIRCQANDSLGASSAELRLELNCTSDSYTFKLQSHITYRDGEISGYWGESTRMTGGNISGNIVGNLIKVRVEGQTFAALLTITTRGDRQSIFIQSPGSEMSDVSITLTRKSR
jgi:hypothetical protein